MQWLQLNKYALNLAIILLAIRASEPDWWDEVLTATEKHLKDYTDIVLVSASVEISKSGAPHPYSNEASNSLRCGAGKAAGGTFLQANTTDPECCSALGRLHFLPDESSYCCAVQNPVARFTVGILNFVLWLNSSSDNYTQIKMPLAVSAGFVHEPFSDN